MSTYDIDGTKSAISALSANVQSIAPYVSAMVNLTMGPQPLMLDGQSVGSWDPLSGIPGLEAALGTVQDHCENFNFYVIAGLKVFPSVLATVTSDSAGSPGIINDLATVQSVLTALQQPQAPPPTPAQRQTVAGALQDIQQQLTTLTEYLGEVQSAAATFMDQMSGDIQTLTQGGYSISNALAQMEQDYENAVTQYVGAFGTAIENILGQIYGQQYQALQAIGNAVSAAVTAEAPVTESLSKFADIFTVLGSDYTTTINAVQQASDAQFGSILQELDIQDAQSYWQNASSFATANGL